MELKPRTKEIARWLVGQYNDDKLEATFKMSLLGGDDTIFSVVICGVGGDFLDIPSISEEKDCALFVSSISELKTHKLVDIYKYQEEKWEVSILPSLFDSVKSDFMKMLPETSTHTSQIINNYDMSGNQGNIAIGDGNIQQIQNFTSKSVAKYLRDKLPSELLEKYPDIRKLLDEMEQDGDKIPSHGRIEKLRAFVLDVASKAAITTATVEAIKAFLHEVSIRI